MQEVIPVDVFFEKRGLQIEIGTALRIEASLPAAESRTPKGKRPKL